MGKEIKIFESKIRKIWNKEKEKWFFSVVDVVGLLSGSFRPRKYWSELKMKLIKEGSEVSGSIGHLKMLAPDGKMRETDVLDTKGVLRIIQSVPSKRAELFKRWLAKVGGEVANEAEKKIGRSVISEDNFLSVSEKKKAEIENGK